ncbi:TetR/AcrR family transcriptional regulator [Bradyrhizobium sp. UFLA01-814]|uniref:TetR/AcrR family transcriptional regulator n=1 Tax=Bradyrhizobium sp. UFLA01-814 TaxID=3023480 RepID=UPI00398AA504
MSDLKKAKQKPRRGAPRKSEPNARVRILKTATELFYRDGIQVTGVDTLAARTGVSKTSLYRTFESKDALIAAVLSGQDREYWAWWDRIIASAAANPRAQLKAILTAIGRHTGTSAYRGCPFINAAVELADTNHPGHARVVANKLELKRRLTDFCRQLGARNSARLGSRLAMLVNGAYATGPITGTSHIESDLVAAAFSIIENALHDDGAASG